MAELPKEISGSSAFLFDLGGWAKMLIDQNRNRSRLSSGADSRGMSSPERRG
jgi:hypothetical protein